MQTRAALLHAIETPFQITTLDLAPPRDGEVLVRMAAAGVCHSDWHLVTGATRHPLPVVAGHEGAGVVTAVGPDVTRVQVGDHVALSWAPSCGHCFYCLHDRPSLCATYTEPLWAGTLLDGTPRLSLTGQPVYHFCGLACFADYTVVPEESCVTLDPRVPFTVAALIGCAVTTGVGAVLHTAPVRPGSSLAVFGVGGVGLSIILGARLAGAARIIAIDRTTAKGELARAFGASDVVLSGPQAPQAVRDLTEGRGADMVFEASGIPAVQELALDTARPGGTIVLVGLSPMGSRTNLPGALITRQEKTVVGSYYGSANPVRDFPLLASLYLSGQLDLARLVSQTYPLEQINEAYADMLRGEGARGVIVFP